VNTHNPLQIREIFHLEFLRWLGKKIKAENYILKGGVNLRFFFNSIRYSEDMDLDISGIGVGILKDTIMKILQTPSFQDTIRPFGVEKIIPPDISKAKQTETTQRFKIHLIISSGEDLFTKVEFSRLGLKGKAVVQSVSDVILRAYKMPPLLAPHYELLSTIAQKIDALATRSVIQARDIFDLYILTSQYSDEGVHKNKWPELAISAEKLTKAYDNIFGISFEQFRDTVLSYLLPEDQSVFGVSSSWDEIKLKVSNFIGELKRRYA